jgi:hypothetical protein
VVGYRDDAWGVVEPAVVGGGEDGVVAGCDTSALGVSYDDDWGTGRLGLLWREGKMRCTVLDVEILDGVL